MSETEQVPRGVLRSPDAGAVGARSLPCAADIPSVVDAHLRLVAAVRDEAEGDSLLLTYALTFHEQVPAEAVEFEVRLHGVEQQRLTRERLSALVADRVAAEVQAAVEVGREDRDGA